jgi:hypothetical protein
MIIVSFSKEQSIEILKKLHVNPDQILFSIDDFTEGLNVELEHGKSFPSTNITNDDPIMTGKIALVHLTESPNYYKLLKKMEKLFIKKASEVINDLYILNK